MGRITRRSVTILLHWSTLMLVLAMIKGGTDAPALRWVFVVSGALWVGLAITRGVLAKPGPKLQGSLRTTFAAQHRGMYALVSVAVGLNLTALLALTPLDWAWNALLVLLVASTFHGLFHFWRHTALNDGALRVMSPRYMQKFL
ncbi:hypothetical protein [Yoonia sp.]|uniref:hypothetical protein n=1 Tax=Yoonia sp. TaxID=2212373 RepID=UPI0025D48851|nr:hypothetical protein [Yoonia sp.]